MPKKSRSTAGGRKTGTGYYGPPSGLGDNKHKKKTGRANAVTRGEGKKKGLKKQGY